MLDRMNMRGSERSKLRLAAAALLALLFASVAGASALEDELAEHGIHLTCAMLNAQLGELTTTLRMTDKSRNELARKAEIFLEIANDPDLLAMVEAGDIPSNGVINREWVTRVNEIRRILNRKRNKTVQRRQIVVQLQGALRC